MQKKALNKFFIFFRYILLPLIVEVPITFIIYQYVSNISIYNHQGVIVGYSILVPLLWIILNGLIVLPTCPQNKKQIMKSYLHYFEALLIVGIIGLFVFVYGLQSNPGGRKEFVYLGLPLIQSIGLGALALILLSTLQMLFLTIATFLKYFIFPSLVKLINGYL